MTPSLAETHDTKVDIFMGCPGPYHHSWSSSSQVLVQCGHQTHLLSREEEGSRHNHVLVTHLAVTLKKALRAVGKASSIYFFSTGNDDTAMTGMDLAFMPNRVDVSGPRFCFLTVLLSCDFVFFQICVSLLATGVSASPHFSKHVVKSLNFAPLYYHFKLSTNY